MRKLKKKRGYERIEQCERERDRGQESERERERENKKKINGMKSVGLDDNAKAFNRL